MFQNIVLCIIDIVRHTCCREVFRFFVRSTLSRWKRSFFKFGTCWWIRWNWCSFSLLSNIHFLLQLLRWCIMRGTSNLLLVTFVMFACNFIYFCSMGFMVFLFRSLCYWWENVILRLGYKDLSFTKPVWMVSFHWVSFASVKWRLILDLIHIWTSLMLRRYLSRTLLRRHRICLKIGFFIHFESFLMRINN